MVNIKISGEQKERNEVNWRRNKGECEKAVTIPKSGRTQTLRKILLEYKSGLKNTDGSPATKVIHE